MRWLRPHTSTRSSWSTWLLSPRSIPYQASRGFDAREPRRGRGSQSPGPSCVRRCSVFLDDDAVFRSDSVADDVPRPVRRRGDEGGRVPCRTADGSTRSEEFPFRGDAHDVETPRPCAYFVGCGAAVRRTSFLDVGGFDERFHYSTEGSTCPWPSSPTERCSATSLRSSSSTGPPTRGGTSPRRWRAGDSATACCWSGGIFRCTSPYRMSCSGRVEIPRSRSRSQPGAVDARLARAQGTGRPETDHGSGPAPRPPQWRAVLW